MAPCEWWVTMSGAAPVLLPLVLLSIGNAVFAYLYAPRVLAVPLGYTLMTSDGLRALGFLSAWMSLWGITALIAPCRFFEVNEQFIGLWFWLGVPLAVAQFLYCMYHHEKRRESFNRYCYQHQDATPTENL